MGARIYAFVKKPPKAHGGVTTRACTVISCTKHQYQCAYRQLILHMIPSNIDWEIWKLRNDKVFNNGPAHIDVWFRNFKNHCLLQSLRFKDDLRSAFCFWLDAYS